MGGKLCTAKLGPGLAAAAAAEAGTAGGRVNLRASVTASLPGWEA